MTKIDTANGLCWSYYDLCLQLKVHDIIFWKTVTYRKEDWQFRCMGCEHICIICNTKSNGGTSRKNSNEVMNANAMQESRPITLPVKHRKKWQWMMNTITQVIINNNTLKHITILSISICILIVVNKDKGSTKNPKIGKKFSKRRIRCIK